MPSLMANPSHLKQSMDIHPTSIVHKNAKLSKDVSIGPYSVIGENVSIDAGTVIGPFCNIDGWTTIGKNCRIFTGAVIGTIPQDLKYKGEKSYIVIGDNNIIREYTTLNLGTAGGGGKTVIGNNNLIMSYAHIAHDCIIGNGTIIANAGTLAGHVTIEDNAIVGGLVAVHQFVRIGTLSIIGGCSKVVQDIPPYSICDGHPARLYGLNIEGLKRAKILQNIRSTLKQAFRILLKNGLTIPHAIEIIEKEIPPCPELSYLIKFIRDSKRGICK